MARRPSAGAGSKRVGAWLKPLGNIFLANSDLSGFSIFEEARGSQVEAIPDDHFDDQVIRALGNADTDAGVEFPFGRKIQIEGRE